VRFRWQRSWRRSKRAARLYVVERASSVGQASMSITPDAASAWISQKNSPGPFPTLCRPPTRRSTRALPEAVQARGRAFVTGTVFDGRETLRACILHPDTRSEHLATLVAEVTDAARALAAQAP
jgi:hypothetical protein